MIRWIVCLLPVLVLAACGFGRDETLTAYGAGGQRYALVSIDGAPFTGHATLSFPGPGLISGQAPCNSYSGSSDIPYPWFDGTRLAVTRRACPEMATEAAFFEALADMTVAEISGPVLLLTAPGTGRSMVFELQE